MNTVPPVAVALGNFDGVHAGHQSVISAACERGLEKGVKSAVWCFENNPKGTCESITDAKERSRLFKELGADYVILEDFEAVRELSPREFVLSYLKALPCVAAFCGFNFRFGKGAEGDSALLGQLCAQADIGFGCLPPVMKGDTPVSSTVIRSLIKEGNVERASELMLHPYFLTGPVCHGRHLGNALGFPTVNQSFPEGKLIPKKAVYVSLTHIDGRAHPSVSNVGQRPTVNGHHLRLETHIIGWEGDLYGKDITVELIKFCRPEKKFDSEKELKSAVLADVQAAREHFKGESLQ